MVDVDHDLFSIECKRGYSNSKKFREWLSQADKQDDKLPIVVWKPSDVRFIDESIVLIKLKDFKEYYGSNFKCVIL